MKRLLIAAVVILSAMPASLIPTAAAASCARMPGQTPGSLTGAGVVFVGTVLSTANGDREAVVKVERIWRGPDMVTYVRVRGTPDPAGQATSVDRTYQTGQRYLFAPENSSPPFDDNSCSGTQLYTSALAAQAPADARQPQPGGDPGPAAPSYPQAWIGLLALLLAAAVLIGWRWRSHF